VRNLNRSVVVLVWVEQVKVMRLTVFVILTFLATSAVARDSCADVARSVSELQPDDGFQATAQLFAAARLACAPETRALLDHGAPVNVRDRDGMTPLAKAAQAGKVRVMQVLIERGANVGARAINGSTPLYYAAEADRQNAVRLLLDHGADPNIPGRSGERPLAAAAFNGEADTVALLIKRGADPNALDDDGKGAMVYAAGRAYAPIVGELLDAGVDVNRRYGHGLTALMWAAGHDASEGSQDVEATLNLLLARGADRDAKDDRGETAADIARHLGHARELKILGN
jgi:ankyrin repeat protein